MKNGEEKIGEKLDFFLKKTFFEKKVFHKKNG